MRKTKLTLLLLAAMLVGVCLGFFAYDAVIRARIQHFSQIPGNMPEHIVARLTERLKLDTDQQAAVRAIVQSYDARLQEAREQSRATLDALFAGMRGEIAVHLTPEQQAEQQLGAQKEQDHAERWHACRPHRVLPHEQQIGEGTDQPVVTRIPPNSGAVTQGWALKASAPMIDAPKKMTSTAHQRKISATFLPSASRITTTNTACVVVP